MLFVKCSYYLIKLKIDWALFMRTKIILVTYVLAVFFAIGCKYDKEKKQFKLTVEVKNTPFQKIYLRKWYADSLPVVDSDQLSPDTRVVTFAGKINEESLFSLNFSKKGRQYDIIVTDTPIYLVIDCNHPAFMAVTGSSATSIHNEALNQIIAVGKIRYGVADSLRQADALPSVIQKEERKADSLEKVHFRDMNNWLAQTSSPILAYELLSAITFEEGYNPHTERLIQEASQKFDGNHFFKKGSAGFNNYINNLQEANNSPVKITDFTLSDERGKDINLFKTVRENKYTLIEFWASWCAPCRDEFPFLNTAYTSYQKEGFQIISVSIDRNKAQWARVLNKFKPGWLQLIAGPKDTAVLNEYGVSLIPKNLLVNNKGKIIARNIRGQHLVTKLDSLYKGIKNL